MSDTLTHTVAVYDGPRRSAEKRLLLAEEPLSIRIEGSPYSVVMRTPGDEIAHTSGFCLSEGIVDAPGDIVTIGFCEEDDTNVATVTLTGERRKKVAGILERKGFVSQSSCGICGKVVMDDLRQILSPLPFTARFSVEDILACVDSLSQYQPLYRKTHAAHAAVVFDRNLAPLAHAEDVGRHNAMDKAIGKVFTGVGIENAVFALMSSRISYELVQKAARAGIELLVGLSSPTALAVELAGSVAMSLGWAGNGGSLTIFSHEERIIRSP